MLAHITVLKKHFAVTERNVEPIWSLSETVAILVATFESLGQDYELKSLSQVHEVLDKLPPSLKIAWLRHTTEIPEAVDLESFWKWLERQATVWEHTFLDSPSTLSQSKAFSETKPSNQIPYSFSGLPISWR